LRLISKETEIIKNVVFEVFGESEIRVFGSRLKEKKGGDIDLFIIPKNRDDLFKKKIKASAKLENLLYKPVDIVVHYDFEREIEKNAMKGIKL
jgi:predicted nucleotidyltransferase